MDSKKETKSTNGPVVIDLDGTLVKTDTLIELFLYAAKKDLLIVYRCGWWLRKGKAHLKRKLTERGLICVETLPYRREVVDLANKAKKDGRRVVLATASDAGLAKKIADHLGLFDEVLGSDGKINMSGEEKARVLAERFGDKKFEYAGNGKEDLHVWTKAGKAHVVSNSKRLRQKSKNVCEIENYWPSWRLSAWTILKAMRPHQWVKNILVFIPMLADHQISATVAGKTALAFIVFCLMASAVYVMNDLFDLDADRRHAVKKRRPFAAGDLPLWLGFLMVPVLLGIAGALLLLLPLTFAVIVWTYFALNLLYTRGIKQIVLLDVIILAVLYVLRVLAGGEASGIVISAWLMALIMFLSLSGALMKRYVELRRQNSSGKDNVVTGRGYLASDVALVGQFGVVNGYMSVLVLALYVNSDQVKEMYTSPVYWWVAVLLLLYAVSRGWLFAYRDKIDDDPIMYILRDPINYLILGFTVFLMLLAV